MTGYRDEHNQELANQQQGYKPDQRLQQESLHTITLPTGAIVLLMGPSGSGKTTWLEQLVENGTLLSSETVSSDRFRQLVGDTDHIDWRQHPREEGDVLYQQYRLISDRAFRVMEETIAARARLNLLTWVDATHLHPEDRAVYSQIARRNHVPIIVIALDVPEKVLLERDRMRLHSRGRQRIKQHVGVFRQNIYKLKSEGFDDVHILKPRDLEHVQLERIANPLLHPLGQGVDVIGDIHGCYEEMMQLIHKLGYVADEQGIYRHSDGRMLVSVGDVMSRGPRSLETMQFWHRQLTAGQALMVDSNHGWKVVRYLEGRNVQMNHGDEQLVAELEQYGATHGQEALQALQDDLRTMLLAAPSHLVFTHNGVRRLVVTHAGIRDHYIGKQSKRISDYCRYGETDGQDDTGKPQRADWFANHESGEWVVWGHDPRLRPTIVNRTVNIDQGAVFGGQLTAYRFPEQSFVSVDALHDYAQDADSPLERQRKRRFAAPNLTPLINGYSVMTDSYGEIGVRSEYVKAAVDTVSHYTVPLEELVYVPPTMAPPAVSALDDYLEHPAEALAYYRSRNVARIVAEKKHMGSRAIVLLFRDQQAAIPYIGRPLTGRIYTRTGRAFFQAQLEQEVLEKLRSDLKQAGYFEQYGTDFVLLDTEIVPWNLKARELISSQYAHVAEAALHDRHTILDTLHTAQQQGRDVTEWIGEWTERLDNAQRFAQAFQAYCWDTDGMDGIQIAPFHILAHSTGSLMDREHVWHMQHAEQLAQSSSMLIATEYRVVELDDEQAEQQLIQWWSDMTEQGHEGLVIKPECMTTYDGDRLVQPAIKVRGRKYLHIIYGMDYLQPNNLKRLKERKTRKKERHALMEFALSLESVERFVRQEPLERMHECVLAALSLEADAVDPRL
ncbi:polynucleotide kinase-phosphatase [Paenibacillus kandeliae]|uniref:polynucleotide kinase-phosphatase n=1 Tax=Paenibacillus kandeliae TaxID=3231269 RepID=UPI00345B10CF